MTSISPEHKAIARAAAAAFGTRPRVDRYWDDDERTSVDILACADAPWDGVTSYSTIGVSDMPLEKDGEGIGVTTELVGACASSVKDFASYLSSAAFLVIKERQFAAPGIIFPDVLATYGASKTMKHFLLLPPFLWEERLQTLTVADKQVAWLLAIPISDGELRMAETQGVPALEELFEQRQIDIFDIERESVV